MRSVEAHLARLLEAVSPLPPFPIGLADARGCVVAEDVTPAWPVPPVPTAACEGYAVIAADVRGAEYGPVTLAVVDVVVPGEHSSVVLSPGSCVRVSLGGSLPEGTEAVVPLDATDGALESVVIRRTVMFGENVRAAGQDLPLGDVVVPAGNVVDARTVALLAAIGRNSVVAHPRPRVVIITVGSDVAEPGAVLAAGRTVDSNGPLLAAAVAEAGGTPYRVGPVSEDAEILKRTIEDQLVRADLVIAVGGASALAYDRLYQVVGELGEGEMVRVAMQPAGAQGFAVIGDEDTPLLMLPANPLSVFVSFEVFVRPLLRRLMGFPTWEVPLQRAVSASGFKVEGGRRNYLRARRVESSTGQLTVEVIDLAAKRPLSGLAETDFLLVVPEPVFEVDAGDFVDVLPLSSHSVK